jgi:cell division cycle 2-like
MKGAYGVVYKAKEKKTGEIVALKRIKMENQKEGFPISSLREIEILVSLNHDNIVNIKEVVIGRKFQQIFMVLCFLLIKGNGVL